VLAGSRPFEERVATLRRDGTSLCRRLRPSATPDQTVTIDSLEQRLARDLGPAEMRELPEAIARVARNVTRGLPIRAISEDQPAGALLESMWRLAIEQILDDVWDALSPAGRKAAESLRCGLDSDDGQL